MKNLLYLIFVVTLIMDCTQETNVDNAQSIKVNHQLASNSPKVDVEISLENSVLNKEDDIKLMIKLVNRKSETQKLLFDKPALPTGGPWGTIVKMTNSISGVSVLANENKAVLSSKIYTEDQLRSEYYNLDEGHSVTKNYDLKDLVVFKPENNILEVGVYNIQVYYCHNPSNTLKLIIK